MLDLFNRRPSDKVQALGSLFGSEQILEDEARQQEWATSGMSESQKKIVQNLVVTSEISVTRAAKLVRNNPGKNLGQLIDIAWGW
ncbi:MAG: hypothetical protein ABJ263_06705 [Tateyamaria sp.]